MSSAAHTKAPAMAWAAVVCRKSSGSCGFTGGRVELASTEGGASVEEEAARAGEAVLEAAAAAATVAVAAASPSPAPITLDTHTFFDRANRYPRALCSLFLIGYTLIAHNTIHSLHS